MPIPESMPKDDLHDDVMAAVKEISERATPETADAAPVTPEAAPDAQDSPPDTPAEKSGDKARARGSDGKFVARGDDKSTGAATDKAVGSKGDAPAKPDAVIETAKPDAAGQPAADVAEAPKSAAAPPPSWSIGAKVAWDKLPKEVTEAILKRESEVNQGFAKLQSYKGLDQFAERAQRSGTTLPQVVSGYVQIEDTLRSDPLLGLVNLAQNLKWTKQEAAGHFLRLAQDLGANIFTPPADQKGAAAPGAPANQNGAIDPNLQAQLAPVLTPILQELNSLKSERTRQAQADQNRQLQAADAIWTSMQADPKFQFMSNLEPTIERLLTSGMVQRTGDYRKDLEAAYELAVWQTPEIRSALIKQQHDQSEASRVAAEKEAAAKAIKASRSVSGSAAPGTREVLTKQAGEDDLMADVRAAVTQHRRG